MIMQRNVIFILLLCFSGAANAVNPPTNLQVVPRYDAAISLVVSWTDASPDETGFEVQRRSVGGAYAVIATPGAGVQVFVDTTASAAQNWEYRVRALNGGSGDSAWVGPSPATSPKQVWPINDGDRDILHSMGTPLSAGVNYHHEAYDISASGKQVDASRGGMVTGKGGGAGGTLNMNVDFGAAGVLADSYLHVDVDAALGIGDQLAPGDRIGDVSTTYFTLDVEADHVHWGSDATNNLLPFTQNINRDPNLQAPVFGDINNDGKDFIIVSATANDHTAPRDYAWGDVDFLVDAYDDMSADTNLMMAPYSLGYWIQSGISGGENVASSATPYVLAQFNFSLVNRNTHNIQGVYWNLPADIDGVNTWQTYLTWIITNTSGTTGARANIDNTQFWRTTARVGSGTVENRSDAISARENQEARFNDGTYFVKLHASDLVNTTNAVRSVIVDNSRPYVKRVTVFSGLRIVYQAQWVWDGATAQLEVQPATFDAAAPFTALRTQDITVEVEFSEPMQSASITAVTPLGAIPTLASSQPAHAQTIWRGLISNLDIADDNSDDGTHMITIDGSDLAGNALLQIANRTSMGANHHNRDGAGNMRGTTGTDSIHGFKIGPLSGVIPITAIFMKQTAADPAVTPAAKALALQTALNTYYDEVSYAEISFAVTGHGWYQLDQPLNWYYTHPQTPLIDLVQEAVTDAQSNAVDLSTSDYVLVVTDENTARDEWSTNGAWPYNVSTAPGWQLMAAGTLNLFSTDPHVTNLAGRMVGLIDLFAYPEVTVARPFVGPWSHMSDKEHNVHVMGWEKWRVGWLDETGTTTGKTLTRVNKPAVASPISNDTYTLSPIDDNTNAGKMLAIEIGDRLHYTVEYRRQQNLDTDLPDDGVLIVKTNDYINQGEGTAIVQESQSTPGDLSDATFTLTAPRERFTDIGSGVDIEVITMTANQAQIRLNYTVPATENDVYVSPHVSWKAEDIWIDAPNLAGNFATDPLTVKDANEKPVLGEVNKVYGRIRNQGHADASNFEAHLEIREPWGAGGPWRSLKVETVPLLQGQDTNANAYQIISAEWTPVGDIHSCVKLNVHSVANDNNVENNWTQENISEFATTRGSPYEPVTSRFSVENPYNEEIIVLFKFEGLPESWSYTITPQRLVIPANGVGDALVTIQPHDGAPVCSSEEITVNAYTPRVDTLKQLGGITLNIGLKNPLEVTANTYLRCEAIDDKYQQRLTHAVTKQSACAIYTEGCTDPGLPNSQVAIVYTAPDGTKQVQYVTTDANGCYLDILPVTDQGLWQTQVVVEESDCREEAKTPTTPVVVTPGTPWDGSMLCTVYYIVFILVVSLLIISLILILSGRNNAATTAVFLGALVVAVFLAYALTRYCNIDICWILLGIVIAMLLAFIYLSRRKLTFLKSD